MIAKLQQFEPETVLDLQRKENWVASSLFFDESNLKWWEEEKWKWRGTASKTLILHTVSISAGPHAPSTRSTRGPLIRHTVYCLILTWGIQSGHFSFGLPQLSSLTILIVLVFDYLTILVNILKRNTGLLRCLFKTLPRGQKWERPRFFSPLSKESSSISLLSATE